MPSLVVTRYFTPLVCYLACRRITDESSIHEINAWSIFEVFKRIFLLLEVSVWFVLLLLYVTVDNTCTRVRVHDGNRC